MAPSPHGPYLEDGYAKRLPGYWSWTFPSTAVPRTSAAWLYAQFVTSKTVSLRSKSIVRLTFIRESDIRHPFLPRMPPAMGPGRVLPQPSPRGLTPTGTNVPDYPRMARLWWVHVGPPAARNRHRQPWTRWRWTWTRCSPTCREEGMPLYAAPEPRRDATQRLSARGAPWSRLANERPRGETIAHERLLQAWREGARAMKGPGIRPRAHPFGPGGFLPA